MGSLDSNPQNSFSRVSLIVLLAFACQPPSECWHTATCPPPEAGLGGAGNTGSELTDPTDATQTELTETSDELDAGAADGETDTPSFTGVSVPFPTVPLVPLPAGPAPSDPDLDAGSDAGTIPSLLALHAVALEPPDSALLEALEPPFSTAQREYRLETSFWLTDVAFEVTAGAGSVARLNGDRIENGAVPSVALELGDNLVEIEVEANAGVTSYAIVVHRRPPIRLVGPNADNRFGHAITAFQDLLVVGAPHVQTADGYVHLFRRSGPGTWTPLADPLSGDPSLGTAVAFDGSTLIVGADNETAGAHASAGAVHLHSFDGRSFDERLVSSFEESIKFRRNLGISVAVSGNWAAATTDNYNELYTYTRRADGTWSEDLGSPLGATDGYAFIEGTVTLFNDWLIVGAHNSHSGPGAFVHRRGANGWEPATEILQAGGLFADSVALTGGTLVVNGEPVRVFERTNDGAWSNLPLPIDSLGSVASSETLLVLGSRQDQYNFTIDNQVHVFRRDGAKAPWALDPNAPLPTDLGPLDDFGYSVATAAGRVFVGAPGELPGGTVYIYD